jgi:primary-amine oxidase
VITTPLTVGYFDGKDGLKQEDRLLKVVSYLDTGDGNYWAHPIENLVAVVDLEQKKIQKIEEGAVVPVPMAPRPYDGRDRIETPKNRSRLLSQKARTTPLPVTWCTGRTGTST